MYPQIGQIQAFTGVVAIIPSDLSGRMSFDSIVAWWRRELTNTIKLAGLLAPLIEERLK
jgi:hypothetical protein